MRSTLATLVVLLAVLVFAQADAAACSPAFCVANGPLPAGTEEAPAHLPANGVTIAIGWPGEALPGSVLTVERVRDGVSSMLPVDSTAWSITLEDVAAGDLLRVSMTFECSGSGSPQTRTSVIEVTEAAPLPAALGTVEIGAPRRADVDVWDNRGSCTSPIASVRADYGLALDAQAEPWTDALTVTAFVDDAPFGTTEGEDLGSGFVFDACVEPLPSQAGFTDYGPGPHRIRLQATVRGTDVVVSTDEATVVLDCAATGAGGCSVATGASSSNVWWLALGALVLTRTFVTRARRRRRAA